LISGVLCGKFVLGVCMVVGDGYVYKMDRKLGAVSSDMEMDKGFEMDSDMLGECKYGWNWDNMDMVGVEHSWKDYPHGVGNHGDTFELSLASLQMILNKNFLHKA